jgi:methylmalonyl-CoA/ethylmalonyl-CoA epimerase
LEFDHVAVAVKNIDQALAIYQALGDFGVRRTEVPGQKVKVALLKVGEVNIELLEPTSEDSNVAKFLRDRGEGLHHIAFAVEDIGQTMKDLGAKGFHFLYEKPADGKFGSRVNFIHPKDTGRVLVEITQERGNPPARGAEVS